MEDEERFRLHEVEKICATGNERWETFLEKVKRRERSDDKFASERLGIHMTQHLIDNADYLSVVSSSSLVSQPQNPFT